MHKFTTQELTTIKVLKCQVYKVQYKFYNN
jgi:hypothetical protein